MSKRSRIFLKTAVWVVCLFPLVYLVSRLQFGDLGASPIRCATHRLGDAAIRILFVGLSLTPIRLLFGLTWPLIFRRLLGLFAFFYAVLHFGVWVGLDHFFNGKRLLLDILKRPYVTVGMLALLLLIPLAATSTAKMMKRLGDKRWRRLHQCVYIVGILSVLHYVWLVKRGVNAPFGYMALLTLLLGIRLWNSRKKSQPASTKRRWKFWVKRVETETAGSG